MKNILLLISIWLIGCQSWDRTSKLTLYNHSARKIYYWVSCDSSLENIQISNSNTLAAGDSIMPYLLFGPEGKGPDKDTWVNAINSADDSSLHVFCLYIDFAKDADKTDSLYNLVIKRHDYKVDSLINLNWKIQYY